MLIDRLMLRYDDARNSQANRPHRGFTLMELLIVVAIIAVLVAVAIPMFTAQLEKSRQATDLANERSAYGVALTKWMTESDGEAVTYYFNGTDAVESASGITGYGQSNTDASTFSDEINASVSGVPNDGTAKYLSISIAEDGTVSMTWGNAYGALWNALSGKVIDTSSGGTWYGTDVTSKSNKAAAYSAVTAINNETRKAADQDILNSIGAYFNNCDAATAQSILGGNYNKATGNSGGILFKYQIDNGYSVRLNPDGATSGTDYLSQMGFSPRVFNSQNQEGSQFSTDNSHNYVDTYLFTSDEVVGTTNREARVKVQLQDGGTKVWLETNSGERIYETYVEK